MEHQRQVEWENIRISEMQSQKEREQERLLKLKAHNQTLNIQMSTLNERIKELSQKIVDTRSGVTNVKTIIDGMRSTRDVQNIEMAQLKARIKEQNQKLVQLSQEKSKLDAKVKANPSSQDSVAFSNKQIVIKQLNDKLVDVKSKINDKMSDITMNDAQLNEVKINLKDLIAACEYLYLEYETPRNQVIEMKNNRKNESYTSSWGDSGTVASDAWPALPTKNETTAATSLSGLSATGSYAPYRALYEFFARNEDEISFQSGDIIMVPTDLNMEPGWLAGEINGLSGYFPETYVEKVKDIADIENNKSQTQEKTQSQQLQVTLDETFNDEFKYCACYPYDSTEVGDLTFNVGELIYVTKKEGDWWTGVIGTRTGIFPSNYVQKSDNITAVAAIPAAAATTYSAPVVPSFVEPIVNSISLETVSAEPSSKSIFNGNNIVSPTKSLFNDGFNDEAKNQAEADSEVSLINTQQQNENEIVQETYSRPMSTTSTTRGKKNDIAQVIAPYDATSPEQLSLMRGQLIMIRKKTDKGWWEGELQAKGKRKQIGWFPATYVKLLQGGRNSGRNTPVSGGRIEMSEHVLGVYKIILFVIQIYFCSFIWF